MKVKELSVETSLLLNIGNYENVRVTVGAAATLEEGDDRRASYKELFDLCALEIKDEVSKINSELAARYRGAHSQS